MLKRVDDNNVHAYWAFGPDGEFGKVDLRLYRTIVKEDGKLAGVTYRTPPTPSDEEKEAILAALEAYLRGPQGPSSGVIRATSGNGLGGGGRVTTTGGGGGGYVRGDDGVPFGLRGRAGRLEQRPYSRRRRFMRQIRRTGTKELVAGGAVSGGVICKA